MEENKYFDTKLPEGKIMYILSFLIPFVVLVGIYYVRDIFPFGENCYLRSDMYHQYAPFYSELWNKLTGGGSLSYSWNMGLGVNFVALYAYYLSSPLNWFIFLVPHDHIIEFMNILIILKLSFSGFTFSYFISKHFNTKNVTVSLFGMFYALSGYVAAYSWNVMWLDCIVLLPLIFLGLERLVKEDKCFLYCITLGFAILSNYYIAIMICLSQVLYFIVLIISMDKTTISGYLRKCANFAIFSLLAGGLSAILLIPEIYALSYTASSDISFPKTLSEYFPVMEMLVRHLATVEVHLGLEHYPNIYCGVAVFILIPLYVMNSRLNIREKASRILLLLVFLLAFNLNIPNFIWHGFHFPNSLPCRQSFIYIFFLLTMCYDAIKDINEYSRKELATAFGIAAAFLLLADELYAGDTYNFKIMYISGAFLIFYMLLTYMYRSKKVPAALLMFLLFTSVILECAVNLEATGFKTTSRTNYLEDNDSVQTLISNVYEADPDFYRIEKVSGGRSKNDNAWSDYRGVSTFSSTAHAGVTDFLGQLGCEHSTNAYSYNGSTFLTAALLDTRYIITSGERVENELLSLVEASGNRYLYKNNYTLPLGFMVRSDLQEVWDFKNTNPFYVQNNFAQLTTNTTELFTPIQTIADSNTKTTVLIQSNQNVYIYVQNSSVKSVVVSINGVTKSYSLSHNCIVDLGYLTTADEVYVTQDDSELSMNLIAYGINTDKFIAMINALSENGLIISEFTDTTIKGTVNSNITGMLFTSIPYDKGWTLYVDGQKTEFFAFEDAFIAFNLDRGTHDIVLKYSPEGITTGFLITLLSIIILVVIYLIHSKHMDITKILTTRK